MDRNTAFTEMWHILDDFGDFITDGYKQNHPPPPQFSVHLKKDNSGGALQPVAEEQIKVTSGSIEECKACVLFLARKQPVTGYGNLNAKILIVLPPPSFDADEAGTPLAPETKDFLDKWIEAVGLQPDRDYYLTNIVKCRPPGGRQAYAEELESCSKFLTDQIDTVKPSIILLLGADAVSAVGLEPRDFEKHRGKPLEGPAPLVISTYDPDMVMSDQRYKRPVWEDLKLVKQFIEYENE